MSRNFKVRDRRNKDFFVVDNIYLNGYARKLGVHATAVYLSLCRHADNSQTCFPSQKLIAEENNISYRTVVRKIILLEKMNLIKIERERTGDGKWLRNTYTLLDRTEWRKQPSDRVTHGQQPSDSHDISQVTQSHTNKTNTKKYTNTLSKRFAKIDSLTDKEFSEISEMYRVPVSFVRSKYDDMVNWHESTGKKKLNWMATLRNWVKKDAIKRKETYGRTRAVDADEILREVGSNSRQRQISA